jgi:hypothetical protein
MFSIHVPKFAIDIFLFMNSGLDNVFDVFKILKQKNRELSDVTKDGALSLNEFCTAMHLVVLRVRNFELPAELPAQIQPHSPLISLNAETAQPSNFMNLIKNEEKNFTTDDVAVRT